MPVSGVKLSQDEPTDVDRPRRLSRLAIGVLGVVMTGVAMAPVPAAALATVDTVHTCGAGLAPDMYDPHKCV